MHSFRNAASINPLAVVWVSSQVWGMLGCTNLQECCMYKSGVRYTKSGICDEMGLGWVGWRVGLKPQKKMKDLCFVFLLQPVI